MNATLVLCLVALAADSSGGVRAKVLYGTIPDQQHRADIEPWISHDVAKAGSPLAQPYTSWIDLTGDEQELYSSMQGGRLIKGKAIAKDRAYEVQISGFKITPWKQTLVLKPGERRVVKLTDYPAPRNVFIAFEAPPSGLATTRAEQLKASVKSFRLELDYNGQEDKPFYRLILSVPPIGQDRSNPFYRLVQVEEAQATEIIDHLAAEDFLDKAVDLRSNIKVPPPAMPGYAMTVATTGLQVRQDLGWGVSMLRQLDGLRTVLEGDAAKAMNLLLGRLSGLRSQWEKEGAAAPSAGARASMKGWELYIWQDGGETYFSLIVGTNRLKTEQEIAEAAVKGLDAIKPKLDELKKGEYVFVHGRRLAAPASEDQVTAVAEYCRKAELKVQ